MGGKYINHDEVDGRKKADNPEICPERFEDAKKIAK